MIPSFDNQGNLPPGVHWTTWSEFIQRFGITPHRKRLIQGLKSAIDVLRLCIATEKFRSLRLKARLA
jgi:hypothetical protein